VSAEAICPFCHGHGLTADPAGGAPVHCSCPVGQEAAAVEAKVAPKAWSGWPPAEPLPPEALAAPAPSYHDLHITTAELPRSSIFNLPFSLTVTCDRVAGWELWRGIGSGEAVSLAGEFAGRDKWLILDVKGTVIVNSRDRDPNED
jgi:hypothetical protein